MTHDVGKGTSILVLVTVNIWGTYVFLQKQHWSPWRVLYMCLLIRVLAQGPWYKGVIWSFSDPYIHLKHSTMMFLWPKNDFLNGEFGRYLVAIWSLFVVLRCTHLT
jgi:hypothetical protein